MRSASVFVSGVMALVFVACSHANKGSSPGVKPAPSGNSRLPGVPAAIAPEPAIAENISVFEALGSTERYAEKRVQLAGVFSKGLRGIFATREHAQLNLPEYGVALSTEPCDSSEFESSKFPDLEILDGEYVRVEAKLSTRSRGEHGIFRVGLCDVTRIAKAGFLAKDRVDAGVRATPRKGATGSAQ